MIELALISASKPSVGQEEEKTYHIRAPVDIVHVIKVRTIVMVVDLSPMVGHGREVKKGTHDGPIPELLAYKSEHIVTAMNPSTIILNAYESSSQVCLS